MHFRSVARAPASARARSNSRIIRVLPEFRRLYLHHSFVAGAGEAWQRPHSQFVSAIPQEGVSSTVTGFALAAEAEHSGPILVLDCRVLVEDDRRVLQSR